MRQSPNIARRSKSTPTTKSRTTTWAMRCWSRGKPMRRLPNIERRSKSTRITRPHATISASRWKNKKRKPPPLLPVRLPVAQRVLRDNQLLNVRGALDNLIRLRVAQIALDRKLGRVAVRAENAQRRVGGECGRFRRGVFRDGHFEV